MAFGDGVGLMAGVALRGGVLSISRDLTRSYHGAGAGSVEEIMRGASAPGMEVFAFWAALGVEPRGPEVIQMRQP
jgi:lipid-binding SYLF domain-containing protein